MRLSTVFLFGIILGIFAYSGVATADTNIAYGTITPNDGSKWFNAAEETMWVPPLPPAAAGQQIAVWWGIGGTTSVVQPLLQYGAGSYSNAWIVTNEMAIGNARQQGMSFMVNPGDQIDSAVEVDEAGGCYHPDTGAGCYWDCGYSINGGPWHWDLFLAPSEEPLNQIVVGSIEVQTQPYQCNWLPNPSLGSAFAYGTAGTAFAVQGFWEPGSGSTPATSWDQFNTASSYAFQPSPGLTQYPTTSEHCQESWAWSGSSFVLLWNPNAAPGQWFYN
jgi:hypothetical protein